MFPSAPPRETLRFSGNKINCFPRDQSKVFSNICILVIVTRLTDLENQSGDIRGSENQGAIVTSDGDNS